MAEKRKTAASKTTTARASSGGKKTAKVPVKASSQRRPIDSGGKLRAEVISIGVIALCFLIILSLYTESGAGELGGFIKTLLMGFLGFGALMLPFVGILACLAVIFMKEPYIDTPRIIMGILLFLILISFVTVWNLSDPMPRYKDLWTAITTIYQEGAGHNGGLLGAAFGGLFMRLLGKPGTYVVFGTVGTVLIILLTGKSLFAVLRKMGDQAVVMADKAGDMVERSRARRVAYQEEDDEDQKSFVVQSLRNKRMEVYDLPAKGKPASVFDYVIEGDPKVSERGKPVELINDSIKKGARRSGASLFESNIKTPDDVIEVIENDAREGFFPYPTIGGVAAAGSVSVATQSAPAEPTAVTEPEAYTLKMSGVGIDTEEGGKTKTSPVSGAAAEQDADMGHIRVVEKVDELDALLKRAAAESAAEEDVDVEKEIRSGLLTDVAPMEYTFPPIDLLKENDTTTSLASRTQIYENSKKLEQTLKSFGVEARVVEVSKGPTVTRYELSPGPGVKVSKISGLADDLALNLAAVGIRIEAPIPGKSVVGIEIPNKEVQPVFIREVIGDEQFQSYPSKLAFALGKDIAGNTIVADIAKMPHLLVAGATGSGKSVCINTLITSILFKARPDEVKLLMVDPKVVELSIYNGIPHLLIPVVTDPKKAAGALNWAVVEMNNRYKYFAEASVRDLKGYNNWKLKRGDKDLLPQIVIIIDELADLMMAAPGEVEDSICRLAQMARAAGLHLIIATQRPSVDVITGLIKANIPSRLAFAVSSGTDSRTVLDAVGAEKLLGKGDMLFNPVGLSKPQRIQGAFISDKEVESIVGFLKNQGELNYDPEMVEAITSQPKGGGEVGEADELLLEAADFILEKDKASVSMLQRRFRVGYNRAARLMEEIEARGIVGPEDGSKPRKIYMNYAQWREYKENHNL